MPPEPQPSPTEANVPVSPPSTPAPVRVSDRELIEYRQCLATVLSQALAHRDADQFVHGVNEDIARCDEQLRLRGLSFPE